MVRFLLGLFLAAAAFRTVEYAAGGMDLAVFVACMVAISIWFKAFEILCDALWSGIAWAFRADFD